MATVNNAHQIVVALQQHGQDMEREIGDELKTLAGMIANRMRKLAPKGSESTLTQSIKQNPIDRFTWEIGPNVDYAAYVEYGVKPGGKGLPRFFDPASASIVDWLQSHPRGGGFVKKAAPRGSKVFQAAMLDLRDRYEGLAWHVRHFGVKAKPFVEPTAREMEPVVLQRLNLAVRRVLAARPDAGSAIA